MTNIEDRLRNAFEHQASSITEESLRPAEPPSISALPRTGPTRTGPTSTGPTDDGSRGTSVAHSRWVWPAAAAAAVVALTIGISVVHDEANDPVSPATPLKTIIGPTTTQQVDSGLPLPEQGRTYDVGAIIGSDQMGPGYSLEIYLHRWKVYGRTDAQVAQHGITIVPHDDSIVHDLGRTIYVAPVAPGATFIRNHCTQQFPESARQFLAGGVTDLSTVLLTFDSEGRVVEMQTDTTPC